MLRAYDSIFWGAEVVESEPGRSCHGSCRSFLRCTRLVGTIGADFRTVSCMGTLGVTSQNAHKCYIPLRLLEKSWNYAAELERIVCRLYQILTSYNFCQATTNFKVVSLVALFLTSYLYLFTLF